jgi:crotonobetaine/carnitine-CoA ligase
MEGYHRRPEANAEQFRGGWFRTGDLARVAERGFHYITGRVKDMIRRSGENVSAREVEEAALLLPEVEDAAVVAVPDADRGEEIKLYLCLKPGLGRTDLPVKRVQAHAREHLASFKMPRYLA